MPRGGSNSSNDVWSARGAAGLGAIAAIAGLPMGLPVLALAGLVEIGLAWAALKSHAQAAARKPRTKAGRQARLRAEMLSWSLLLPISVGLFALATVFHDPPVERVVGKPVEVRSEARLVIMPDGGYYIFTCGSSSRPRGDCPALAAWKRLPRWPEPQRVEMEVAGHRIYGLRMDGQTIVDRRVETDDRDVRPDFITVGLIAALVSIGMMAWRGFKLARIRQPRRVAAASS